MSRDLAEVKALHKLLGELPSKPNPTSTDISLPINISSFTMKDWDILMEIYDALDNIID
jgi:hypothetical protein